MRHSQRRLTQLCISLFVVFIAAANQLDAQIASQSTNQLNFGNQAILTTSSTKSVRLKNTGTAALGITSIAPPSQPFSEGNNCPATLAPGASCTISVAFSPTVAGNSTGSISIFDNGSGSPQKISLAGTGVLQTALSSSTLSFGTQAVGTTGTRTVTLYNNLNTVLTFGGATASGDFAVVAAPMNPCGSSVPAGGHCAIDVTFTPAQPGTRTGTLTVTDSANNTPLTANLSGTGTTASVLSISVSPASPTIAVGATEQFAATGLFPGGITLDLTKLVNWSSSPPKIASISNTSGTQGLATGKAAGTTTIKAALSTSKYATTLLTVTASGLIKPTIAWPAPAAITYGTPLSSTQLDATASSGGTSVAGTYTYTPAAGTVLAAGTQTLSVVFTPTNTAQYTTASLSVSLTVTKAAATVTLSNMTQTYTGSALSPIASTSPSGLSVALAGAQDISAGTYSVTATVNDPNYTGSATGSFVISPATATVTLSNMTQTYTGAGLSPTATTVPSGFAVTFTGAPDTNAGTYTVTGTVNNANYTGSASGSFVVGQATSTVLVTGGAFTYDGNPHPANATATGVGGATVSGSLNFTYNGSSSAPVAAGTFAVAASFTSSDPNYANASGSGTITINPPAVTLVSIAVTPAGPSVAIGATQQFKATGTFSDNSTQVLTTTATWASSATNVATISNTSGSQGLANGVALGVTTITAISGTVQGTSNLAVTGSGTFVNTGNMLVALDPFTTTMLLDGRVLIAGGFDSTGTAVGGSEIYDSAGQTSTAGPSMVNPHASHTATLLNNGKVLIVGGFATFAGSAPTTNAELYDPIAGTFSATGSLNTARAQHSATLLPDGTVLIAGGVDGSGNGIAGAELYNPASGQFTAVGTMATARLAHSATLLYDGTVLIAGGAINNYPTPTATAELYTPAAKSFSTVVSMTRARAYHTATLLNDGTVLLAGGLVDNFPNLTATMEIYSGGSFFNTGFLMSNPRAAHTATLMGNGTVLIAGGAIDNTGNFPPIGTPTNTVDLWEPGFGLAATGSLITARSQHTATLLANGAVLIAGGTIDNAGTTTNTAELYQPTSFMPAGLTAITISPASSSLAVGTAQRFIATGTYAGNVTQRLASVTWTSADVSGTGVAQVSNDSSSQGVALGLSPGTASITATLGLVSGSATFNVSSVNGIVIAPANPAIPLGTTQQFTATGSLSGSATQDFTNLVAWGSSGVASISASGLASSTAPGPSTITATFGANSASTILTVGPPALVSIAVTPVAPIQVNASQQFTAIGTFTDGSTQNLSTTSTPASWISSLTGVAAIVANTGIATAPALVRQPSPQRLERSAVRPACALRMLNSAPAA